MKTLTVLLLVLVTFGLASGQIYTIRTIAGGALPVNVPAPSASLGTLSGVAVDASGNVFAALSRLLKSEVL